MHCSLSCPPLLRPLSTGRAPSMSARSYHCCHHGEHLAARQVQPGNWQCCGLGCDPAGATGGISHATATGGATSNSLSSSTRRVHVACTSTTRSKQSCMFSSVCLQLPENQTGELKAVLWSSSQAEHVALLRQHLGDYFQSMYNITCQGADVAGHGSAPSPEVERSPTVLWVTNPANQESFGHALVNEVSRPNWLQMSCTWCPAYCPAHCSC